MQSRSALRLVISLLLLEAIVPAVMAHALTADSDGAVTAFGILPLVLAAGLWTGRRFFHVLARGHAGLQVLVTSFILLLSLLEPNAPYTAFGHVIPRFVGLIIMSLFAVSGWAKWRILGRIDVAHLVVSASW